ncbi:MAG TPA: HAD-IIIA family hydrolase, partial [Ferruginibacter sp.]|nr:HAD-IIIA family hydrolase [Ferruginibacter sp.]
YVNNWSEFVFHDGVAEAFKIFNGLFKRIIIVTNQRGVSKGLTLLPDLQTIHINMQDTITKNGGRIDAIYFCIEPDDSSACRKPNTGMALQAIKQFPDIDFKKAIMVGDKITDMEFGRNLDMQTVFISSSKTKVIAADQHIDEIFDSLISFAKALPADKL